jgi:hypothetical protein
MICIPIGEGRHLNRGDIIKLFIGEDNIKRFNPGI